VYSPDRSRSRTVSGEGGERVLITNISKYFDIIQLVTSLLGLRPVQVRLGWFRFELNVLSFKIYSAGGEKKGQDRTQQNVTDFFTGRWP